MYEFIRKLYRKSKRIISKIKLKMYTTKCWIMEYYSILKERKNYKNYKIGIEDKKLFKDFWKKNYGRKVSLKWHKLYASINGKFNVCYMPEVIYTKEIEPYFNKFNLSINFADKSVFQYFFKEVKQPIIIAINNSGIFVDKEKNLVTKEVLCDHLLKYKEFIIKPTVDTGAGRNVKLIKDINDVNKLYNILDEYKENYIIQEKIKQSECLSNIYPHSVNTIRVITYILDNQVKNLLPVLRMGINNSIADNWHFGGIAIGIDENGKLKKYGYNDKCEKYEKHPNSKLKFEGYKINGIQKVIEIAKKIHCNVPHVRIISWDFTIDIEEEPILIEANYKCQTTRMNQLCHEELFGNDTEKILKEISRNKYCKGVKK